MFECVTPSGSTHRTLSYVFRADGCMLGPTYRTFSQTLIIYGNIT